jgi:FtsH-binding integral membrane protein
MSDQVKRYAVYPSTLRTLLYQIFAWFAVAIFLSGMSATVAISMPQLQSPFYVVLFSVAQLCLVVLLSATLTRWSYATLSGLFILYAVLSGITLSIIGVVYQLSSLVQVFFLAAALFVFAALYGWYTKRDLSSYRFLLMMTLWGVALALLVNIWLASSFFDTIVAMIGVLLFSALTAYDIQHIQRRAAYFLQIDEMWHKITLMCALQLYLDFINLFLSMLRLWGRRNDQ